MFYLENRIGLLIYHILPNHILWNLLSEKEKETVLRNNIIKNNRTYSKTEKYCENHLQNGNPLETQTGEFYARWVEKIKPTTILEIGPGGGFYTQVLFEKSNIVEYDMVDCVQGFIEIVEQMISKKYSNVKISSYYGDFLPISKKLQDLRYDLIMCNGTIHHLPNRIELAKAFQRLLKPEGIVISCEMTHYIPRFLRLLRLYLKFLWRGKDWYMGPGKPCTHHGLTLQELKQISNDSNLSLEFASWDFKYKKDSIFRFKSGIVNFVLKKH